MDQKRCFRQVPLRPCPGPGGDKECEVRREPCLTQVGWEAHTDSTESALPLARPFSLPKATAFSADLLELAKIPSKGRSRTDWP